jgi:hypothetical protein
MKKLIVSLLRKKKLFKNVVGGLKLPRNQSRSHSVAVVPHKGSGRKLHQGLGNLSIKPLKFKF